MTTGLWFWLLIALWALSGFGSVWRPAPEVRWWYTANWLLVLLLFLLIGWKLFGAPIR